MQLIFLLYAFLTGSHVALLRFVSLPGDLLGSTQVPCAMWNIYAECKGRKLCSHLHSVKPKHIADCVFKLNTCRVKHFLLDSIFNDIHFPSSSSGDYIIYAILSSKPSGWNFSISESFAFI